jgi:hypothetical protein
MHCANNGFGGKVRKSKNVDDIRFTKRHRRMFLSGVQPQFNLDSRFSLRLNRPKPSGGKYMRE